jgi:glutamate/tyrosine decarboxylase-like PLP-dependent enzyme
VLNAVQLNQVLVAFGAGSPESRDVATRAVIATLQARNLCFAGGASWRGRWVLRLSLVSHALGASDVDRLAAAIENAWKEIREATERTRAPTAA